MTLAQSRITTQGQVSIPVSVMRLFGFTPGEVIEWKYLNGHLVVQKAGNYTLNDVQMALKIPSGTHKTDEEIKEGIKARMREKYARRSKSACQG